MELGPGIARILGPLVLGRSRPFAPKDEKSGKAKTCAFRRQSLEDFPLKSDFLG